MSLADFFNQQILSHLHDSREFLFQLLRDLGGQCGAALAAAWYPVQDRLSMRYHRIEKACRAADFNGQRESSLPTILTASYHCPNDLVMQENLEALELIQGR